MSHWDRRQRSIASIVWPSFLAACLATALFFAGVDPDLLQGAVTGAPEWSNTAVYTAGFFFFWLIAATASTLTTWLIRTERRRDQFPHQPDEG